MLTPPALAPSAPSSTSPHTKALAGVGIETVHKIRPAKTLRLTGVFSRPRIGKPRLSGPSDLTQTPLRSRLAIAHTPFFRSRQIDGKPDRYSVMMEL
jgi:hypothetical protein